jgi:hypothetical protein
MSVVCPHQETSSNVPEVRFGDVTRAAGLDFFLRVEEPLSSKERSVSGTQSLRSSKSPSSAALQPSRISANADVDAPAAGLRPSSPLKRGVETKGDAAIEYRLGEALLEKGRVPEAEEAFKTAIGLKPDFTKARFALGVL